MKLYVKDGEVYFDYSDIDDTDFKSAQTRHKNEFLRGGEYSLRKWDRTLKPKVLKMRVSKASWM